MQKFRIYDTSFKKAYYAELKQRLAQSPFRSRFRLTDRDRAEIAWRGWPVIAGQAHTIVRERLAAAFPRNDGKQTPMRGSVIFIAQHATGCCCRGCLAKWHGIPAGRPLSEAEIDAVAGVLEAWLRDQAGNLDDYPTTPDLFG